MRDLPFPPRSKAGRTPLAGRWRRSGLRRKSTGKNTEQRSLASISAMARHRRSVRITPCRESSSTSRSSPPALAIPAAGRSLYRVLWRLTHGERYLLEIITDPDVNTLMRWEKSVRRDVHKMRAFVRFRAIERDGDLWYIAWFEPEHHIVELNQASSSTALRKCAGRSSPGSLRALGWKAPRIHIRGARASRLPARTKSRRYGSRTTRTFSILPA